MTALWNPTCLISVLCRVDFVSLQHLLGVHSGTVIFCLFWSVPSHWGLFFLAIEPTLHLCCCHKSCYERIMSKTRRQISVTRQGAVTMWLTFQLVFKERTFVSVFTPVTATLSVTPSVVFVSNMSKYHLLSGCRKGAAFMSSRPQFFAAFEARKTEHRRHES